MSWSLSVGPTSKVDFPKAVDAASVSAPDDQKKDPTFGRDTNLAKEALKQLVAVLSDVTPICGGASGHIPTIDTFDKRTIAVNVHESS